MSRNMFQGPTQRIRTRPTLYSSKGRSQPLFDGIVALLSRLIDRINIHPDTVGTWAYFFLKNSLTRKYLIGQTNEHWIFRFNGRSITLRKNDMADLMVFLQVLEKRIYDFPLGLCRSPKHIVDCGANIGLSAVYFADTFKGSRVYGFEIDEGNLLLMKKNTEPFAARVCITDAGIYKTDGFLYLERGPYNYSHKLSSRGTRKVKTLSLETVMERFGIDFMDILKIDIEGGEFALTERLDYVLPRVGCLMIEFERPNQNKLQVRAFKEKLRSNGFIYLGSRMNVDCYMNARTDRGEPLARP